LVTQPTFEIDPVLFRPVLVSAQANVLEVPIPKTLKVHRTIVTAAGRAPLNREELL